jgi:NTE family protein
LIIGLEFEMKLQGAALVILMLLSAQDLTVYAGEGPSEGEDQGRPKIGLALSGGGARGSAHVGVIKVLEELNVPIDYIAGTSMGAIIGGIYAAGYSADELEQVLENMNWSGALTDKLPRREQSMRKKDLDAQFLIPYRVGFNKGGIQLPLGVIEGQHLDQVFHRILLPVQGITDFDQLSIPFRAVATDLVTGEEVVLSSGSLPDALRASMSVPGAFAPVQLNGQKLVDGGMSNNLPVSVVREMGADIVIAVDISTPLLTEEQLVSVLSVAEQLTGFLTRRNTEEQIASLGPGDILLVPDLEGVSAADFENADEIVKKGLEAAMARREDLAVLSMPQVRGPAERPPLLEHSLPAYRVQFITINNGSVLDDEIIRSRLELEPGQPLDILELEKGVDRVYSLDVFESVTYNLVRNEAGEQGVEIIARPRSWGPNYLQFGLEFSDDFSGNNEFKIGAAYTRNALNSLGGELRVTAAFGREDELIFDFYQPLDTGERWFIEPQTFLRREQFNVWENDSLIAKLDISGYGAKLGFGRNFSTTDLIRMDYQYFRGDAELVVGVLDFPLDGEVDIGELLFEYRHDSLDSLWFPTQGMFHRLDFRLARDALGAAFDYEQASAAGTFSFSIGKNTLLLNYEAAYSFDDAAPVERWFELGGFARLSGLIPDQLSGRHLGILSLAYLRRLNDIDILPAYAGITLEAGNVWNYADDISFGDLRKSGSIFVGAETPLGPVYLAWGYSDNGDSTFYFYLGNPFRRNRF